MWSGQRNTSRDLYGLTNGTGNGQKLDLSRREASVVVHMLDHRHLALIDDLAAGVALLLRVSDARKWVILEDGIMTELHIGLVPCSKQALLPEPEVLLRKKALRAFVLILHVRCGAAARLVGGCLQALMDPHHKCDRE